MLRRKRGADYDLSDSDDGGEARRRMKRRQFAKMQKALFSDERVKKMAENPGNQAFLRTMEDRGSDDEMDFLDIVDAPASQGDESQSQSEQPEQPEQQQQRQVVPDSQPRKPLGSAGDNRAPAHMRRTKDGDIVLLSRPLRLARTAKMRMLDLHLEETRRITPLHPAVHAMLWLIVSASSAMPRLACLLLIDSLLLLQGVRPHPSKSLRHFYVARPPTHHYYQRLVPLHLPLQRQRRQVVGPAVDLAKRPRSRQARARRVESMASRGITKNWRGCKRTNAGERRRRFAGLRAERGLLEDCWVKDPLSNLLVYASLRL
jgi:hypothetical protein